MLHLLLLLKHGMLLLDVCLCAGLAAVLIAVVLFLCSERMR